MADQKDKGIEFAFGGDDDALTAVIPDDLSAADRDGVEEFLEWGEECSRDGRTAIHRRSDRSSGMTAQEATEGVLDVVLDQFAKRGAK
jgi:hypothetical protein